MTKQAFEEFMDKEIKNLDDIRFIQPREIEPLRSRACTFELYKF